MDEPPKSDKPAPSPLSADDLSPAFYADCRHVAEMRAAGVDLPQAPDICYVLIDRGAFAPMLGALMCPACANAVEALIRPYCLKRAGT